MVSYRSCLAEKEFHPNAPKSKRKKKNNALLGTLHLMRLLYWCSSGGSPNSISVGTALNAEKSIVMLDTSYKPVCFFASEIHILATFHSEMYLFCFGFHDMNIRARHTGSNQGSF